MKNYLFTAFILMIAHLSLAQPNLKEDKEPITWEVELEALQENEYMLTFIANISDGWYLYSQYKHKDAETVESGPQPTFFKFAPNTKIELGKAVREFGELKETYDETFKIMVKKYDNKVTFKTIIQVKELYTTLEGQIQYMTCNSSSCLPGEVPFEFRF